MYSEPQVRLGTVHARILAETDKADGSRDPEALEARAAVEKHIA